MMLDQLFNYMEEKRWEMYPYLTWNEEINFT